MKISLRVCFLGILNCVAGSIVSAQTLNVTYVCSGEHIYVEYCSTQDLSDKARCMIAHPDKPPINGGMVYTYDTRGNLKTMLATCQQPSADDKAKEDAFQKKVKDTQDAAQKKNLDGMASVQQFAPPKPTQLQREQAEIRECMEAGREPTTCMGETMAKSLQGMMAEVAPGIAKTMVNKHPPGLYLTGVYKGAGNFVANFGQDSVSVACRDMVPDGHSYTVEMNGNRAVVNVQAQPHPFSLTFRPDGTLVGPAAIDLKGNVVVGQSTGVED